MNRIGIIQGVFIFTAIIVVQAVVFKGLVLFGTAFCFIYLIIFLLLPKDVNPMLQLLLGFGTGLVVDTFYNTPGIHAFVSTFSMFVRPFWIKALTPSGGYDMGAQMNINAQGLRWFISYAVPFILLHCILLLFIEAGGFHLFWRSLAKALYSTFFTFIVIITIQYLFFKKERY